MQYIFVIRQTLLTKKVHETALELVKRLFKSGHSVTSIIFTGDAACAAMNSLNIDALTSIQNRYAMLNEEYGCELLVCGRAFKNLGGNNDLCDKRFTLSGNVEFAMRITGSDRVIEL